MDATEALLRRLAAGDESCLRAGLGLDGQSLGDPESLDRRTRSLVQLAALVTAAAATESLRWAVERACATGASEQSIVEVLVAAGWAAGAAQTGLIAPRMALALDLDVGSGGARHDHAAHCPSSPASMAH